MSPDQAIQHARQDIENLSTAPTQSSCERLLFGIRGYCRALLDCDVITDQQFQMLLAEADAELARREESATAVEWPK